MPNRLAHPDADRRVAEAFGSSFEDYNEPTGEWLWRMAQAVPGAVGEWWNTDMSREEQLQDFGRSMLSVPGRVAENTVGTVGDASELKWSLAKLINDALKGSSGMDMGLDLARAENVTKRQAPTSEDVHEYLKRTGPGALTYEPKGPKGQLLHLGADLIDPVELGGAGAARALMKGLR